MGFTTKVLHTKPNKNDAYGALRFPIYANAAFEFASAEDIEAAFKGTKPAHAYSRSSNPTVENFEKTILNVTGGIACIGFSSGMGAISACLLALCKSGDEIVSSNKLFGTTYSLFTDTFAEYGIVVKCVDFNSIDDVRNAITNKTRAIFFETITNPQIEIYAIDELVALANSYAIPLVADTTATPPYMFDAKLHGIHISVLSSTKFISGGGTAIGGLLIDNGLYDWKHHANFSEEAKKFGAFSFIRKLRLLTYRNLGACMSVQAAQSFSLGLETMELRIDRACANAQKVAEFLEQHSKVQQVRYAGLERNIYNERAQRFFTYPGSIICFELSSKQNCFTLINAVQVIRRATNLHDNKTLIIHPSSTIYSEFSLEKQTEIGVNDTMIRLSVGIENCEDIIADLSLALSNL
ncbi:MAG TPA: aminotransferase class I/II-fold pyridoxal phosphate-dependent enzyme [Bacteroidales bacterium]|nr:MAG: Methionine gamma-lyase [Bacteroidetes bacterium ADurb.Bin217]HPM13311.1 aminotransferase class I/II-fold pyridoxal phosphate-dependent enzyme [Bacteroidales bacterium]